MKRRQFVGYCLLFLGGCTSAQVSSSNSSDVDQPEKLRLAVTDVQGLEDLESNYGKFRQALEQVLETPIEFFPVESYTAAAVALQSNQVDLVLTGPSEYVVINARTKAIPMIALARQNYYSVIAVLANSPIQSLTDLKGKIIGLKKIGSTSGHIGPTKLLMDAGLEPNVDYQVEMLGLKDRTDALLKGSVAAWGGGLTDYQGYVLTDGNFEQDFSIIAQSSSLPNDVMMVSSLIDPDLIATYKQRILDAQDQLLTALVVGEETQKYQGAKFVEAQDSDYDVIREVYIAMGAENLIQ